jgi:hypothetical protein
MILIIGSTKKCELCGIKFVKYKCANCNKEICTACYWYQFGVCRYCAKRPRGT